VGAALFNFAIQLGILVATTVVLGQFPTGGRWGYAVLALAVLLVFATAVALLLAAVNVYLRDVAYLVEIMIMILFWASPIVYSWGLVQNAVGAGSIWERVYLLNPMTQVIMGFQKTFWVAGDGEPFPDTLTRDLFITLGIATLLLWFAQRVFARLQSNFAQEL
jgi:ABC-2 type transport system permease protein